MARQLIDFESRIDGEEVIVQIGMYLPPMANVRLHWALRAKMVKEQRHIGGALLNTAMRIGEKTFGWTKDSMWVCTLTRLGSRVLDDDNVTASFKAIRDGIAEALGVDDGPKGPVKWQYDQIKNKRYGVQLGLRRLKPSST